VVGDTEEQLVAQVVERLAFRYAQVPVEQISLAVHNARAQFEQSRVRDFVPLLIERLAHEELTRHGRLEAAVQDGAGLEATDAVPTHR
jgi:hypothetical protein